MEHFQKRAGAYAQDFRRAAIPELLFETDLGLVLGMTPESASDFVRRAAIPHVHIDGRLAVRRDALLAWLRSRETPEGAR